MRRWIVGAAIFAGLGTLGSLGGCQTAGIVLLNQFETTAFEPRGDVLYMAGEINSQTLDQFEEVIAANPSVRTIVECDVPGSLDDDTMIALSYQVRELGLNTHLTATSVIASGGVDFFLAGVERTMEAGAEVGVHSWSDGVRDAADYPRNSPEHEANRAYIEQMLGDDAFYWFTINAAPADDIYWMADAEIAEYGMLTAPIIIGTTPYGCAAVFDQS